MITNDPTSVKNSDPTLMVTLATPTHVLSASRPSKRGFKPQHQHPKEIIPTTEFDVEGSHLLPIYRGRRDKRDMKTPFIRAFVHTIFFLFFFFGVG